MMKSGWSLAIVLVANFSQCRRARPDPAAVERGRIALTQTGHLLSRLEERDLFPGRQALGRPLPRPQDRPRRLRGRLQQALRPPPRPLSQRRPADGPAPGGEKGRSEDGIQIDCMACHGGSIGGASYVGLGNSTLDLKSLFDELTTGRGPEAADLHVHPELDPRARSTPARWPRCSLSFRNPDWSRRLIPMPLGANLPEMDTPAWWLLGRKETMYYDGRTPAESVRTNMQFTHGREVARRAEGDGADLRRHPGVSQEPPPAEVSLPDRPAEGRAGQGRLREVVRQVPRHLRPRRRRTRTSTSTSKEIGTDPARALGMSRKLVEHYNATWFGGRPSRRPGDDGLPGPAARRHLGDRPLSAQRLGADAACPAQVVRAARKSSAGRPRPTSRTTTRPTSAGSSSRSRSRRTWPGCPRIEAKYIFDASRFGLGNGGQRSATSCRRTIEWP